MALSAQVIRYGVEEALPERVEVRAGPLTAILEGGDLRYISAGGEELVRRIYVAVRDRSWGTVPARLTKYAVERGEDWFTVDLTAEHVNDEIDFAWTGRLEGIADGEIRCELHGTARRTFRKNRIGFCVLHPMALAGRAVEVQSPNGEMHGQFPVLISPHQPFLNVSGMAHEGGGGRLVLSFAGDLFETEDQRNWTDASYKTYSTPLSLPYPAEIKEGEQIAQTVTLHWEGSQVIVPVAEAANQSDIAIESEPANPLPAIGLMVPGHGVMPEPRQLAWLRALNLDHLRLGLNLNESDWRERLDYAARLLSALDRPALELELVAPGGGDGFAEVVAALRDAALPIVRVLVFPEQGAVTTRSVMERARSELTGLGKDVLLGGGSRNYFTELNRATLPLELMDVVGYGFTPQVHAFDNASMVESLAAQPVAVESTRVLVGDRPLTVGPITLRPRFNPKTTGAAASDPNRLPASVDLRQVSLFAAGWLIGSLRRLAETRPAALTYFETTGWRGVIERTDGRHRDDLFPWLPGALFPVCHVLLDVGQLSGARLVPLTVREPLRFDALALRYRRKDGQRMRVLVASFVDEPVTLRLTLPRFHDGTLRLLDETTAEQAMFDPSAFRKRVDLHLREPANDVSLALRPFAIACLDVALAVQRSDAGGAAD